MRHIRPILLAITLLFVSHTYAQTTLPYPLDTINGKIYYRYVVPRGIGIYRIGVNFGVTQEEILQANPRLLTHGIRYDEVILVPAKLPVSTQEPVATVTDIENKDLSTKPQQINEDSVKQQDKVERTRKATKRSKKSFKDRLKLNSDSIAVADTLSPEASIKDSAEHIIRLAVMLPFQADALKRDKNMDRFVDFYSGVLLAVNEVQKEGQKIEIFTYDVGKDASVIDHIMQDSTWQSVDAIIGPTYPLQVTAASKYALRDSTWLLIPFSSSVNEVNSNPYILKFNPSSQIAANTLVNFLSKMRNEINCVLIEAKETDNIPKSISYIQKSIKQKQIPYTTTTIRHIYTDSIEEALIKDKENIIIFNTENYNNIHTLIPNLEQAGDSYNITLYSQFSWIEKDIELPQIYTSVFRDTPNVTEKYSTAYQEYFGHKLSSIHPRYDLLGYDLTAHLLHMLQQAEIGNGNLPTDATWNGTQANIQYKKLSTNGGYENQIIHIIRK